MILYCLDKSSSDSIGVSRRDTVKKAAKLAVYEAIIMKPNSHHVAATRRPDRFFGASPPPCERNYIIYNGGHDKQIFRFVLFYSLEELVKSCRTTSILSS